MTLGTYGWVKLTRQEQEKLLASMGEEELDRCVAYVDESAQKTGNKNGWKDWALVVTTCHRDRWGVRKERSAEGPSGNYQPTPQRIRKNGEWLDSFLADHGLEPAGKEGAHAH